MVKFLNGIAFYAKFM